MKMGRREFIGALGAVGTGLTVADRYLEKSITERSKRVKNIAEFFRGKAEKDTIRIFNKNVTYEGLAKFLQNSVKPPIKTLQQTKELMFAFADMIEVEDKFDKPYNSAPIIEQVDQQMEGMAGQNIPITASFGYSQINPFTALRLATENVNALDLEFAGMAGTVKKFKGRSAETIKDKEIVDALDLSGNGNLVFGFQAFYEVYNIYGRDSQANLHTNRTEDPRVFSLAVAGYSGTPFTPLTAKIQVMTREMQISQALLNGENGKKFLSVDGSLGKQTKQAIQDVFGDSAKIALQTYEASQGFSDRLKSWEAVSKAAEAEWKQNLLELIWELRRSPRPEIIATLLEGRYFGINALESLLNRYAGKDESANKAGKLAKIKQIYEAYYVSRDAELLNLVRDEHAFNQLFPKYYHLEFLQAVLNMLEATIIFDQRYKGVIPTSLVKRRFADDINIARRVALGHKIKDENQKFLPQAPLEPRRPPSKRSKPKVIKRKK